MPKGSVPALQQEMLRRVSKRYDDVEVIIKSTSNDGLLSVTRTADKDSAKTFVQETLKDTWESADEWFVR
ncbi:damage-inducible protein DinI [Escherichia coli O157:H7 str. EC1825]|nr:damage-inducible protein DinI [Escherichia coli O157:H7 str. EC1825]